MKEDKNMEVTFESGNVEVTRYLDECSLCGVMRTKPWSQVWKDARWECIGDTDSRSSAVKEKRKMDGLQGEPGVEIKIYSSLGSLKHLVWAKPGEKDCVRKGRRPIWMQPPTLCLLLPSVVGQTSFSWGGGGIQPLGKEDTGHHICFLFTLWQDLSLLNTRTSKQVLCTTCTNNQSFFFFNLILFTFGCAGSLMLHAGFLQLQRAVATFHCGVQASHCSGFSCCRAQTLHTRSSAVVAYRLQSTGSMLQHMSSFAPQHVGCS